MPLTEVLYERTLRAARPLVRAAAPLHARLRRAVNGRRDSLPSLEEWAAVSRATDRPLIWFHAPSVGEALMAQATMAELRRRLPDAQLAFTFFSPSAEPVAGRMGADVTAYLPWDVTPDVRRALAALRPAALAFVRTEIWPVLTREAAAAGVPVALVNAALSEGSGRLRPLARRLLAPAYRRLDGVGAVSARDAARFAMLGVAKSRRRVTGDARFDQVHERVAALDRSSPLLARLADEGRLTLIAGSTWPADEQRLLPIVAALRADVPLRLIIAPHEPTPAHLTRLTGRLTELGIPHGRLSDVESDAAPPPPAIVVDRMGVLAELYAIGDLAYVGGGFGSAGLHSVVEPAALGVPVVFGPRFGNTGEAADLAAAGGGFVAADGATLRRRLEQLLEPSVRERARRAANQFVNARLGGAAANAELIVDLLKPGGGAGHGPPGSPRVD